MIMIAHLLVTFGLAMTVLALAPLTFGGPPVWTVAGPGAALICAGGVIARVKGRRTT